MRYLILAQLAWLFCGLSWTCLFFFRPVSDYAPGMIAVFALFAAFSWGVAVFIAAHLIPCLRVWWQQW